MDDRSPRQSLYDPRDGAPAICLVEIDSGRQPIEPPRSNCFSIYWIKAEEGEFWADAGRHAFGQYSLLTGRQKVVH